MARNIKDYSVAPNLTNVKLVGFNESTNTMYKVPTTLFPTGGGGGATEMQTLWTAPGDNTTYKDTAYFTLDRSPVGKTFSLVLISKSIRISGKTGFMNSPVTHIPFVNYINQGAWLQSGVVMTDWDTGNWVNIDVTPIDLDDNYEFVLTLTDDIGMGEPVLGISRIDIIWYN